MDDAMSQSPRRAESQNAGSKTGAASGAPIVVKKYANRRLYNTSTSSYVTLENLAAMVREGQDFVVQDARSGDDITRSVLTQVIFEEEARGREPMLPTSFLRQLIRLYGDTLQRYVPGYLEMTMSAFERNQETFRAQMERSFGKTPAFAQFDAITRANVDMFRQALEMFATFTPTPDGAAPAARRPNAETESGEAVEKASEADGAELEALKLELEAMRRKIDALAGRD